MPNRSGKKWLNGKSIMLTFPDLELFAVSALALDRDICTVAQVHMGILCGCYDFNAL